MYCFRCPKYNLIALGGTSDTVAVLFLKQNVVVTFQMKLMRGGDLDYFKKFYRMTPQEYDYVLKLVEDDLRRSYVCREPISASERLAMTLR